MNDIKPIHYCHCSYYFCYYHLFSCDVFNLTKKSLLKFHWNYTSFALIACQCFEIENEIMKIKKCSVNTKLENKIPLISYFHNFTGMDNAT